METIQTETMDSPILMQKPACGNSADFSANLDYVHTNDNIEKLINVKRPITIPGINSEITLARSNPEQAQALRVANLETLQGQSLHQERNGNSTYKENQFKPTQANQCEQESTKIRRTSWNIADLIATNFPEPKWIVPGLIPFGLSVLGGRPKVGKSWLALQLALAVGTGGYALGEKIEKGKVLYLAYEDTARRLKNRLIKLNRISNGDLSRADIQIELAWDRLDKGGLNTLYQAIDANGYTLVVIDTFARALGHYDQKDLTDMTEVNGQLQELTKTFENSILQIDHFRKPNGFMSDPIDDIIGSTGKAAVVDAALGLYKEQGKRGAILKAVGRDIEEKELALEFDTTTGGWHSLGDATDVKAAGLEHDILSAIEELTNDKSPATCANLAKHLHKDRGNIYRVLCTLENKGIVKRLSGYGKMMPYEIIQK